MSIRILLADDHTIMQAGLRALLEKESDMEIIAEAANGREAVKLSASLLPHVVIMDISMPDLNGIDATRQIVASAADVKIIALSMHSDEQFVRGMLQAGAQGYLLKDCAAEELCYAVRAVFANHTYLSPAIAGIVAKQYVHGLCRKDTSRNDAAPLTTREREVIQLLAEGKASKEIASSLFLSVRTIEAYRRQIMDKLGIHSVAQLTKYAIRHGFTSLQH